MRPVCTTYASSASIRARALHLAGLVALWAVAACGAFPDGSESPAPGEAETPADTPREMDAETRERLEELYRARVASSRERFVEEDVEFMRGMILHHAQALAMVDLVPDRATAPSIRTLGARIRSAQRDEIALMERWLDARGLAAPQWRIEGTAVVVGDGGHAAHHMPGMLSERQMSELEAARGRDFDRLFLQYMIQHHEGALEMVRALFAADGAAQDPEIFRFASDVQVDQATEIARMERMLQESSTRGRKP